MRGSEIALARSLLLLVAQHLAGDFVDQVYPGAGRTGHNLIAVSRVGRRRVGQPHLNVHAGLNASKNQLGHFIKLAPSRRHALTCLNFDAPHVPRPDATPPGRSLFGEPLMQRQVVVTYLANGELK